jgi:hypothetical protein
MFLRIVAVASVMVVLRVGVSLDVTTTGVPDKEAGGVSLPIFADFPITVWRVGSALDETILAAPLKTSRITEDCLRNGKPHNHSTNSG